MSDPDSTSIDFGFDIQEMVAQRMAVQNKKTVQLSELLRDTKFTREEIRTMYRGFKQVRPQHKIMPFLNPFNQKERKLLQVICFTALFI